MPPRRTAAARIASKGYALPAAQTGAGASPARGSKPAPMGVPRAVLCMDAAAYQLRGAARALQEAHPGFYAGQGGFGRVLRDVSLAALQIAQAASRAGAVEPD